MNLYIIRHAHAVELGERGITDDAERPLSEMGEQQARAVADGLRERGLRFDMVLTSPLLRARQTAEQMLKQWPDAAPEVGLCDHLSPGGKRRKLARFLRELAREELAVVGHEPDLSAFAGWLIGGKKAQITFAKAGVACIAFGDGPRKGDGSLEWLVTPDWFGTAGRKKGAGRG